LKAFDNLTGISILLLSQALTDSGRFANARCKPGFESKRLSCHRFRANQVRLWLSLIAHNLGNLWRRLVLPGRISNWFDVNGTSQWNEPMNSQCFAIALEIADRPISSETHPPT
jgi:hypothetical protein